MNDADEQSDAIERRLRPAAWTVDLSPPIDPKRSGCDVYYSQTGDDLIKSTGVAYVLWALCIVGLCGIHRFYAGKVLTGIIWLFTLGLLGFGQLVDLVLIPGMITNVNLRFVAFGGARQNVSQNVVVDVVNPNRP